MNSKKNFFNINLLKEQGSITPYHHGDHKWISPDSLENFKKSPKLGYDENSITYIINKHGFRCMDIIEAVNNRKPIILTLGCSFTLGIGVDGPNVWSEHFCKYFGNHNLINFGVGGGSSDTVVRLLSIALNSFTPAIVAILWPVSVRLEEYNYQTYRYPVNIGPWLTKKNIVAYDECHFYNNSVKNFTFAKYMLDKHNIKNVQFQIDDEIIDSDIMENITVGNDRHGGRDSNPGHPGHIWHKEVAEKFIKKYEFLYGKL